MGAKISGWRARSASGLLVAANVDLGAPRAVHKLYERHHVDVSRPGKWGNPFVVGRHGTRQECVELHKRWVQEQEELMAALHELRGLVLGCYCGTRRPYHAKTLVRLANEAPLRRGMSLTVS